MLRTYKSQSYIAVSPDEVWATISHSDFVTDFLPEVGRDICKLTLFTLAMHKHPFDVMPAYMVPNKIISWDIHANTAIELARKDLSAEIEHIDITLEDDGNGTAVTIEVHYQTRLCATFLQTERTIRGLFNKKLNVLKQDLELTQPSQQLQAAFN
tara:strand:+ start:612 stop:1076 length:465 start_codon:yes stop_codon:yes gene_type:complete